MLETAAAAVLTVTGEAFAWCIPIANTCLSPTDSISLYCFSGDAGSIHLAIVSTAITSPLLLGDPRLSRRLSCGINLSNGSLQMMSASPREGTTVHATSSISFLHATSSMHSTGPYSKAISAAFRAPASQIGITGKATIEVDCADSRSYGVHPAASDSATHLGALFDISCGGQPRVPVSLDCLQIRSSPMPV